jgi:class 3 adenylate cyclase
VFDGVLARCTTIVEAHAGRVLKYAGDGLGHAARLAGVRRRERATGAVEQRPVVT